MIKYAFRLVHIANIPHVHSHGFVHKDSPNADPNYIPIGDQSVISVRETKSIQGGDIIGSYIPFYFGPRSPMLYVVQHGYNGVEQYAPQDLVYCVVLLSEIILNQVDCVFTDGHALNCLTHTYSKDSLPKINDIIKYTDVYTRYWNSEEDRDLKRRKEAELLVKEELAPTYIKGYIVYDEKSKDKLIYWGINPNIIIVKKDYYF